MTACATVLAGGGVARGASGTITPGGPPVTITTTASNEVSRVTFAGTSGHRVFATISGVNLNGGFETVDLLPPGSSTRIGGSGAVTGTGYIDTTQLPSTGTYTLLLTTYGGPGPTTLKLYDVPADTGGSTSIDGGAFTARISTPGQNARFTFAGSSGQQVYINRGGDTVANSIIQVLTSTGTVEGSSGIVGAYDGSFTVTLTTGGTHTLLVDGFQDATGTMAASVATEQEGLGGIESDQSAAIAPPPPESAAAPVPVTPSGPAPAGSYTTLAWDSSAVGTDNALQVVQPRSTTTAALTGVVVSALTQAPIPNAQVTLSASGSTFTSTTDVDGSYGFVDVPAGSADLSINAPGYASYTTLNNSVIANVDYEVTSEVSLTPQTIDETADKAVDSSDAAATAPPGTAYSQTRVPPVIRVKMIDTYPPHSFDAQGNPLNCTARPTQPANPPINTYALDYYVTRTAKEETEVLTYNDVGWKAFAALVQGFAWYHKTLPGPYDVDNSNGDQCFRPSSFADGRFMRLMKDVHNQRLVRSGQLFEPGYRSGPPTVACTAAGYSSATNLASQ